MLLKSARLIDSALHMDTPGYWREGSIFWNNKPCTHFLRFGEFLCNKKHYQPSCLWRNIIVLKRFLIPVLLIALLIQACSAPPSPPLGQNAPTAPVSQLEPAVSTTEPTQVMVPMSTQDAAPKYETAPPDCLDGEVSPIGQSIAEDYEFTYYEEVITWFCNGAEFEDILVALETESQAGTPAEEMLGMLADGFTWYEIWQLIGLTE